MKNKIFALAILAISLAGNAVFAQPTSAPVEKDSNFGAVISKNLVQLQQKTEVSPEKRKQAYEKLLEAQRHIWMLERQRSQTAQATSARLARQALQAAVELDPTLAEAYTTLAELTKNTPPYDINESIMLANIAVKIDPNNFGGHQILAQLYTFYAFNSKPTRGAFDASQAQKAINEWKEVARLDPRNAEAFAFLSELYARSKKQNERIEALRNWLAAAAPISNGFYGRIFQGESLMPEAAAPKLGAALLENNQTREAVEILARAVSDDPENGEAIELLGQALEQSDASAASTAIQALQQAVYANSENATLVVLLARVQAQSGKINEAAKLLREATAKKVDSDLVGAANLQVVLGDIFAGANRTEDAVAAYKNALTVRGVVENEPVTDDERDFVIRVFDKMIDLYKKANRPNDAKALIERARTLLGKNDLFADKQLISFYRENGNKGEALKTIRALRLQNVDDYSLLRLEASILTESGKVEEAVALVKTLINKTKAAEKKTPKIESDGIYTISAQLYDDFSNYLFISNLYSQAKRGKEAVGAANEAFLIADGSEKKQIAKLALATAQQTSGDFKAAEETLRALLKQTPGNPIALNNLGYFLTERNEKLDEALQLIKQAVEIDPTNPSYLDSLGWVYFKLGKLDEAEKYLKIALKYDAASATIQEHLGDVYQKKGKTDLANSAWQKAAVLAADAEELSRLKSKLGAASDAK